MSKKLVDRRFVTFDSVQIDVDTIQALAYQLQQRSGQDADGKPITVNVQVAVLMLESGSSVTIGDESLRKFEHWWQGNVTSEKVVLPAPKVEAVVPPIAANTDKKSDVAILSPAVAAAPAPAPKAVEPVAAAPVSPTPENLTPKSTPATPPAATVPPTTDDAKAS